MDDGERQTVYSHRIGTPAYNQQLIYGVHNLQYGQHTLTVTNDSDNWVTVDFLAVDSSRLRNDTDPGITYDIGWRASTSRSLGDLGDDVHSATRNGTAFSYPFTGTGISYLGERNADIGTADVYIDDTLRGSVDASNPTRLSQQVLWQVHDLPAGQHTLRVVKTGGQYATVDAVRVEG